MSTKITALNQKRPVSVVADPAIIVTGESSSQTGNVGSVSKPNSSELNPGPGFRVKRQFERPPADIIKGYEAFDAADISDITNRMFTMRSEIRNLTNEKSLVGPALTVKLFPGDNLMLHKALDLASPGDVVVVDTSESRRNAVFGDMIANKAKHVGIRGFIIDGLIRDLDGVKETGIPVYARGVTAFGPLHRGPGELNYAVSCGGIVVNPGDIISADQTGITVVRKEFAAVILEDLNDQKAGMENYIANVKRGVFSNSWVDEQLHSDSCVFE